MKSGVRGQRAYRSHGGLTSVIFLIGIFMVLLFACIGVDVAHFVSASTELQSVADASALAGCYELTWNSSAANMSAATAAAQNMAAQSNADLYSSAGIPIPPASVNVSFSSRNGGTNNTITVSVNPPVAFLFAPFIGAGGSLVGATASAQQLPLLAAQSPPWYLETTVQNGPGPKPGGGTPNLPSPAPPPPTTFPSSAYVTFFDSTKSFPNMEPPILPTHWVEYGISDLSTALPNPVGTRALIDCMGVCNNQGSCTKSNPIVIGGAHINSNHGSYNSAISNPQGAQASWTNGSVTLLPITTNGDVVGVYTVKLTGPMVPNSFKNGQGVFGEFQIEFIGSANNVPGAVAADPTSGTVFNNVGSTLAQLVQ